MRAHPAFAALLALASLALPGCVTRPCRGREHAATSTPPSPEPSWERSGPVPEARLTLERAGTSSTRWDVVLPSRAGAAAPAVARAPVRMTWFRPTNVTGRRPAVVVSPILGSETAFVEDFAERFAREGWHALAVYRPEPAYDPAQPLAQVEERLQASVSGQVQALDWLLSCPDVDPRRIASFGISAGGIQGAMVAGADPRYVGHVIALAGGPLADVFVDTDEERLARLVREAERREGVDREVLRERLRAVIRTDPVLLGRHVAPERVLLVLARFDRAVPYRHGRRLEEALGRPETVVLPLGHYSSVLAMPFVKSRVLGFLHERFEAVAPAETGGDPGRALPSSGPSRSHS